MIEQLAQKMLNEGLDFLPLEDSLKLFEEGTFVDTRLSYVVSTEELGGDVYELTNRQILEELLDMMGENAYAIGGYGHFDEFTHKICPAPTYIDLIKHK